MYSITIAEISEVHPGNCLEVKPNITKYDDLRISFIYSFNNSNRTRSVQIDIFFLWLSLALHQFVCAMCPIDSSKRGNKRKIIEIGWRVYSKLTSQHYHRTHNTFIPAREKYSTSKYSFARCFTTNSAYLIDFAT